MGNKCFGWALSLGRCLRVAKVTPAPHPHTNTYTPHPWWAAMWPRQSGHRINNGQSATTLQDESGLGGPTRTRATGHHPPRGEWTRWAAVSNTHHRLPPYKSKVDSVDQCAQDPPDTTLQEQSGLGGPTRSMPPQGTQTAHRQPPRIGRMDSAGQRGQYPPDTTLHEQSGLDGARPATTPQEQNGLGGPMWTRPTGRLQVDRATTTRMSICYTFSNT